MGLEYSASCLIISGDRPRAPYIMCGVLVSLRCGHGAEQPNRTPSTHCSAVRVADPCPHEQNGIPVGDKEILYSVVSWCLQISDLDAVSVICNLK